MSGSTQSSIGLVSSSLVAVVHHTFPNHHGKTAKVYFDSIPPEFIEWVQRNASVSSSFPWLSECTNFVSKRPTGAPTVHVVVSTLTHTTSSIVATRPGNIGGAVPSSKTTSRTSAQASQDTSTEVKPSSTTRLQTSTTEAAKQTSTSDIRLTSATSAARTSANQSPETTVQQASSTSIEQASPDTSQQIPSTEAEQSQTTIFQQSTAYPSSAVDNGGSAQLISIENDGGATLGTNVVSDAAPHPSATTNAAGSQAGTQVSSIKSIPTNGQAITTGGYTEPQQTGVTTSNEIPGPSTAPQGADASQVTSPGAVQSNKPFSISGTTIAVAPVLTLGSETVTANPSSEYIISSQTLAPGGPAITVGETTYSLAPFVSAIVENGQTQSLAPAYSVSAVPQITLGSSVITANPIGGFIYAFQTISAGGPAVTADGNTYSLATSGATIYVVQNGITQQPAAAQTTAPVLTFGNSAVTANSDSVFVVGSRTLKTDGSAIVVGETTYSLATSGSSTLVVQNGVTSILAVPTGNTPGVGSVIASSAEVHVVASVLATKVTIDASVVTQNTASEFVVAGQTLSPGGSAVEVEGTTYPLAPSASAVPVNGVTSALPLAHTSPVVSVNTDAVAPAMTVGSSVFTRNSASEYVIGTQTLVPGGSAVEVQGTTYSLAPSATALVVDGMTTSLAGETTAVVIAGQTLSQGSEIAVQGTTYSLAPLGTAIIINGQTSALPTSPADETPLFAIGSTTLKSGEVVTVQGTTYSIPASDLASPVVVINGKTSTLPATQGTGAAVLSGLQRTTDSLSGSRVTGSATTTSTQDTESASRTQGVASTSTAGAGRSVQRVAGDSILAVMLGIVGMVLF